MPLHDPTLPEYASPPVSEVVLGVQFNNVEGFQTPHVGLVWEQFRQAYPRIEEHAPLLPSFEVFAPGAPAGFGVGFQLIAAPGMPRVFFISKEGSRLFQLQSDRFLHNWRQAKPSDIYPRFEQLLAEFDRGFADFVRVMAAAGLGPVVPNQCEISYVNHLVQNQSSDVEEFPDSPLAELVGGWSKQLASIGVGPPEDARFLVRYVLRNESNSPVGRLFVSAEPATRMEDGQPVIQLTLTAKGEPPTPDLDGVRNFLSQGRERIVRGFTELTSKKMHETWGRTR